MNQTAILISVVPVAAVIEPLMPGPKSTWVRASSDGSAAVTLAEAVARYPLSNAELLASVPRFRPPESWYDEDHEGLY